MGVFGFPICPIKGKAIMSYVLLKKDGHIYNKSITPDNQIVLRHFKTDAKISGGEKDYHEICNVDLYLKDENEKITVSYKDSVPYINGKDQRVSTDELLNGVWDCLRTIAVHYKLAPQETLEGYFVTPPGLQKSLVLTSPVSEALKLCIENFTGGYCVQDKTGEGTYNQGLLLVPTIQLRAPR